MAHSQNLSSGDIALEMANLQFPRIFLLPTHLDPKELHYFEEVVPALTYDIHEADLVIGRISKRERAEFELRRHKLKFRPGSIQAQPNTTGSLTSAVRETVEDQPGSKRRKLTGVQHSGHQEEENSIVRVLKLSWLTDCLAQGAVLPVDQYLLLEGFKITSEINNPGTRQQESQKISAGTILQRAAGDHADNTTNQAVSFSPSSRLNPDGQSHDRRQPPPLVRQTTSEHEITPPSIPDFLHTTYSCQRPTPMDPPNGEFVLELKKIRTLRLLEGDQIGVRAYSTSIATLSAYPHVVQSPHGRSSFPSLKLSLTSALLFRSADKGTN